MTVEHPCQGTPVQNIIRLGDLSNIERTDLKPYCLLLETKDKRYYLAMKGDEELYGWQDDIYSRSPLSGVSNPTNFVHNVHVGFNHVSGAFTGMPDQWSKLLTKSAIKDYQRDPQAVPDVFEFHDVLEFYMDQQKREMEEMRLSHSTGICDKGSGTSTCQFSLSLLSSLNQRAIRAVHSAGQTAFEPLGNPLGKLAYKIANVAENGFDTDEDGFKRA
ncbi:hypothetical protein EWM64_g1887 [Hericium alpestre]|uniref:non-specific serine/threonine protein kinase n=1 Tax=Hericium alpestre TaxID=135208 RepID=A0A4Z0A534_9AGAM|nr:hypothetical protein EWM64_g1887 [Hericium alpestre]